MADVFISYKSQDRPRVALLVRALQERGLTVWWDRRLETGADWLDCIKRALDASQTVLAIWTPQSVRENRTLVSWMMKSEIQEGQHRNILVQAQLEKCPHPFGYDGLQAADLTSWSGEIDSLAVERLAATICEIVGPRTPFPPAELSAWLAAEERNHPEAFREFSAAFPSSRFTDDVERRVAELVQAAADLKLAHVAAQNIIRRFEQQAEVPAHAPPLGLEKVEKDKNTPIALSELLNLVASGGRLQLQAEPGAGKTVSLLAWARAFADDVDKPVGIYVRLQELAGDDELLEHIGKTYATGAVRLDAWQALLRSGAAAIFCDGWNELSAARRESIGDRLDNHTRLYPDAGLVVGSRPLSPSAFTGAHTVVQLLRLTPDDLRAIVNRRLGDKAPAALAELRASGKLQQLVRNPFFLHAFCISRAEGVTPTTRYGLIKAMIEAGERVRHHAQRLRNDLADQQSKFLRALAVHALAEQKEPDTNDALRIVNSVAAALASDHLLVPSPRGRDILDVLRDHHCLVEHAGPPVFYGFQHQLIEEWYAAEEVLALALAALTDNEADGRLTTDILNERQWAEALLFAVESAHDAMAERACAHLILRMVGVDCQFAARLIASAPVSVWRQVAPAIMAFADAWKPMAGHELVRFAVSCGKEEFAPYIWEAIAVETSGSPANALRGNRIPHPAVLGSDWKEKVRALDPETRRAILYMLASNSGLEAANMAVDAAIDDPSADVQISTAEMLHFYRYDEELDRLLAAALPETWEGLSTQRRIDELWEGVWREQTVAAARRVLARLEPGARRLSVGLLLRSHGEAVDIDLVAELFTAKFEYNFAKDTAFNEIKSLDGARLSQTLVARAIAGERIPYLALDYVREDEPVDQAQLLAACRLKSNSHGNDEVLAPLLSVDSINTLFRELFDLRRQFDGVSPRERQALSDAYHTLLQSLATADTDRLLEAILFLTPASSLEISLISDVIARAFRHDGRNKRRAPRNDLRVRLNARLAEWSDALIDDPHSDRHALSDLAEAIGAIPHSSLLTPLHRLLSEDLRRWKLEKEAYAAGLAAGRQRDHGSGAHMSYAFRYAENLLSLAKPDEQEKSSPPRVSEEMTAAVVDALCSLLTDPEFGADASRAVATLFPDPLSRVGENRSNFTLDLKVIPERLRLRVEIGVGAVSPVAARLLDGVRSLLEKNTETDTKLALGVALQAARMACGDRFAEIEALVNDKGSLENNIGLYMSRLFTGHSVSAHIAERCLDELDGRRERQSWEYDQSWQKWKNALQIMAFGGKPIDASNRLLTYDPRRQNHDERDIVKALGLCAHPDALAALQLLSERCEQLRMIETWCSAVYDLGTPEAGQALLAFELSRQGPRRSHVDSSTTMIADLAARHPSLRHQLAETLQTGTDVQKKRIADIVSRFNDEAIVLEFLALPPDIVQRLERAIEATLYNICFKHEPSESMGGAYDVVPVAANGIRTRLFRGAHQPGAAKEAYARLLRSIDVLRAEYGRSQSEARHPDISMNAPWPEAANVAWQAASALCAQR